MKKQIITLVAALALAASGFGQVVFSDDMSGTFSTNWTGAGSGISSFSTGALLLDNNGIAGETYAYTSTTAFGTPYNSTLASNAGLISWSFNMATLTVNPSDTNRFAFVLAADSSNFTTAGGYAVRVGGNSPSVDPLTLVYFTGGVNGSITTIASGETMNSNNYANVKVTYDSASNGWSLFGTTGVAFSDPSVVATLLGSGVNSTGTGSALNFMGAWSLHTTGPAQDRRFDNVTVTAIPEPSTYAVIMGVLTLGFIIWRRRQKA